MNTNAFRNFQYNINKVESLFENNSSYTLMLIYANIITVFEVYLQEAFVDLLKSDDKLLKKLTESSKYKNSKITLNKALKIDMNKYLIGMTKNLVFHNLADIEPLYKEVLGVNIRYTDSILKSIETRHHIIHRNGYTKDGEKINMSLNLAKETLITFKNLVGDIENQILQKYVQ